MLGVFSYLITMFGGLFWIFRAIVAITYTLDVNFPITPLNFNVEIILLFVTLICFVFIFKRNIFGALVYFVAYGLYFGTDLYNGIENIVTKQPVATDYFSLFISFLGVLIPLLSVLDIFLNKNRKGVVRDKETDWFYKNKKYNRNLDERADKNQYKF